MTPYFFTKDQFNAARDCVQHCEVLYAASPDLLRTAARHTEMVLRLLRRGRRLLQG